MNKPACVIAEHYGPTTQYVLLPYSNNLSIFLHL